jgi:CHAT domain-containing protein/tetratricopeptide (TPR) repeat protein
MRVFFCLYLCFLFLGVNAYAQNIPQNSNKTDRKGLRQGKWTITFNKDWAETKLKDSIAYYRLITYKDDKPQGITRDYYLSGKVQWEAMLKTDRPQELVEGKAKWYHENGQTATEVNFVQGLKEGQEINYEPSGIKSNSVYYSKGLKQGKEIIFDEAGKPSNLNYYDKGEIIPLQKIWDNAVAAYESKHYASADTLFADIYLMFKGRFGAESENCPPALSYLWNSQNFLKKYDQAGQHLEEMLRVRELQKTERDSLYRDWLYDAVVFYKQTEQYPQIEKPLLRLIEIQTQLTGEQSDLYLTYRRLLGDYYRYQKRYKEGETVFEQIIQQVKVQFPTQPEKYGYDLAALGYLYEAEQAYEKAEKMYIEAIERYKTKRDTSHVFAAALKNLVDLYQAQDKNTEAVPFALMAVDLQKKRKGAESAEYSETLLNLQQAYRELQQFSKAEEVVKERLRINKKMYGEISYEYASAVFDYALLRTEEDKNEEAKAKYSEAIQCLKNINTAQLTPDLLVNYTERHAELCAYLGEVYAKTKDVVNAEKALLEATEAMRTLQDKNKFVVAQIYEKIGTAQTRIDNYSEAEEAYKEAIKITKGLFGEQHHNYIQAIANLATLYSYSQQAPKAILILDELLAKLEQENKTKTSTYIQLINSKVLAYTALGQDSAVIASYEKIAANYKEIYGEDSPNYMNQYANLIKSQISAKRLKEAETNLKNLEKIAEKKGIRTIDKFYYGTILVLKGFLANTQGNYGQAIEYAKEENAIGRFLGKPKVGLVGMALNSFMNNQPKEATEAYKTYINYVIDDVRNVFPYLSDNQKVGFYNSEMQYHLDLYYYTALAEPLKLYFGEKDSAKIKARRLERQKINYIKHPNNVEIFNYQLITKGILFESSQKMRQAILGSDDADLIRKFNEWQAKKEEMNKLFQTTDSKQKEEKKTQINQEITAIEKQLAMKSSFFTQKLNTRHYTWQDVQKKLKKGEALVEILAINAGQKLNPSKGRSSDMYLAFIITPETKDFPLCVRIADGDTLERKYANNYQNCIKAKKADKYSYNKYWKKLADTLKSAKKIYFAPDGIYHKVNINTLQNPETGKYVIEEKEIQFISQARDFITQKAPVYQLPTNLTLFGAPNYNSLPQTEKGKENNANTTKDRSILTAIQQDTSQRFLQGNKITELKGTETEVNNLEQIAQKAKIQINKYLGDDANEEALKSMTMPSVLHIATHGFFVSTQSLPTSLNDTGSQRNSFAGFNAEDLKNPLRRSGLLFAYCSHAFGDDKGKHNLNEDGILTSEEAQNLHLDKTDLVVLSACETGLGEVKNGEGVYGLQRAFQTAGAKSVLMSLWTVSDNATQELMTLFYENWIHQQMPKRQAFTEAQKQLKAKFPEPYYWGAFVMVGE